MPGAVAPARRQAEGGDGHAPRRLAVGGVPVLAAGLVLGLPQAHEEPGQALQLLLAVLPPGGRGLNIECVAGPLVLLAGNIIDFKNYSLKWNHENQADFSALRDCFFESGIIQ